MTTLAIRRSVLPGFGLTLGISLTVVMLMLIAPLAALVSRGSSMGIDAFAAAIASPRTLAAFRVSILASAAAAVVNTFFGLITAWVLVRYRFAGRELLDMLIDIPFALPTSVAGITLATLYGPSGLIGGLLERFGVRVAYTPVGIAVALVFVTLPFAVRTLQPVIRDLDPEVEDAAQSLGASSFVTFVRVVLPELRPALLTAFTLCFARAVGEYGSVIFIAGNMPMKTETVTPLIMVHLDQFEYGAASAIALSFLAVSLFLLALVQQIRWRRAT